LFSVVLPDTSSFSIRSTIQATHHDFTHEGAATFHGPASAFHSGGGVCGATFRGHASAFHSGGGGATFHGHASAFHSGGGGGATAPLDSGGGGDSSCAAT